jgi:HSP20 family protein
MLERRNKIPTRVNEGTSTPTRFSDWIDDFFDEALNLTSGRFTPGMNIYETDDAFELTMELPGMKKDNIDISIENNMLNISGERKASREENGRTYHRVESRFGKFSRNLPMPNNVDDEGIEAKYENGVLTVNLPKTEQSTGKRIQVK